MRRNQCHGRLGRELPHEQRGLLRADGAGGYEPILQVSCRDRNRIAIRGDLLGAAAEGGSERRPAGRIGDDSAGVGLRRAFLRRGHPDTAHSFNKQSRYLFEQWDSVRVIDLNRVELDDTFGQVGIVWLIVAVCAQAVLHFHGDADRNDG